MQELSAALVEINSCVIAIKHQSMVFFLLPKCIITNSFAAQSFQGLLGLLDFVWWATSIKGFFFHKEGGKLCGIVSSYVFFSGYFVKQASLKSMGNAEFHCWDKFTTLVEKVFEQ